MMNKKKSALFYVVIVFASVLVLFSLFSSSRGKSLFQWLRPEATPSVSDEDETIVANPGLKITFSTAEIWTDPDEYGQPVEGMQYIRLLVVAENTGLTDQVICSEDFSCYADNLKMESYFFGDEPVLMTDTLSAGRRLEKYLYFSVPINAEKLELEYHPILYPDFKRVFDIKL